VTTESEQEKSAATCALVGEYIFTKTGNTVYWYHMNGSSVLETGQYDITLEGASPNERIAAIGCRLYFSWTLPGEMNSDLYYMSLFGGAPVRVTSTDDISEIDPALRSDGGQLAFTALQQEKVNVDVSDLNGGNRSTFAENGFAPAYDTASVLSYSAVDKTIGGVGLTGVWHTFSPGNTPLAQDDTAFNASAGLFGDPLSSAYYRPDGGYAVTVASDGTLQVTSVDGNWLPTGSPTGLGLGGQQFAIWVNLK
jgi:hypothetical protein